MGSIPGNVIRASTVLEFLLSVSTCVVWSRAKKKYSKRPAPTPREMSRVVGVKPLRVNVVAAPSAVSVLF